MTKLILPLVVFCAATVVTPLQAQQPPQYKAGPWHYRSIACVDTTVVSITPRLQTLGQRSFTAEDFERSGVQVSFKSHLGVDPLYPRDRASVTHYQNQAGNAVMIGERPSDRVQVCFLGGPSPTHFCDPDKDARGRLYRVYDYRQHASYYGMNSEHDCGGA